MGKGNRMPMEEYWRREIERAIQAERMACIQVVQELMERTSYSDGHMACRAIREALRARDTILTQ